MRRLRRSHRQKLHMPLPSLHVSGLVRTSSRCEDVCVAYGFESRRWYRKRYGLVTSTVRLRNEVLEGRWLCVWVLLLGLSLFSRLHWTIRIGEG